MWAMQQTAPGRFERIEVPPPDPAGLAEGQVIVRFRAGGLCGSDSPKFEGHMNPGEDFFGQPGSPMHELVGIVEASRDPELQVGQRVVGSVQRALGLRELVTNAGSWMAPVPDDLDDLAAVTAQPVATVLNSLAMVPPRTPGRALVLGLGPQGLLFTRMLHAQGWHVTGIDRIDRHDVAAEFGIDEVVVDDADRWGRARPAERVFDLVVDAVGHSYQVAMTAAYALADHGHLVLYGLPDEFYVFPMWHFLRRNATLTATTTTDWRRFLREGLEYVRANPATWQLGVSHVLPVSEATRAYEIHTHPSAGRYKVVLTPDED